MKNSISIFIFITSITFSFGQLAIGKAEVEGAGTLDFSSGENKGILLPIVSDMPENPANGTFVFNNDQNHADKLKVMVFEKNQWKPLSEIGTIEAVQENGQNLTTGFQPNLSEEVGEGVVIGTNSEESPVPEGILVLESKNQALILPKVVDPHLHVKSPRAGTILYDITTKSLVVFDGEVWNYWQ